PGAIPMTSCETSRRPRPSARVAALGDLSVDQAGPVDPAPRLGRADRERRAEPVGRAGRTRPEEPARPRDRVDPAGRVSKRGPADRVEEVGPADSRIVSLSGNWTRSGSPRGSPA